MLGPVESISMNDMKKVFETNFFGTVRMIKEVMPDMKKRRAGHIIVMSSVMGLQGKMDTPGFRALTETFCHTAECLTVRGTIEPFRVMHLL